MIFVKKEGKNGLKVVGTLVGNQGVQLDCSIRFFRETSRQPGEEKTNL